MNGQAVAARGPPRGTAYPHHDQSTTVVAAPPGSLFAFLDDHMSLSSHMNRSSWMMGGGKMKTELGAGGGKAPGSTIRLSGRVFGIPLWVDEVVTERTPPYRKTWETVGQPRLLVIGPYRMGFVIAMHDGSSQLTVFIDYDLPDTGAARWLGRLLGGVYARWCTRQMAQDAVRHFAAARSANGS